MLRAVPAPGGEDGARHMAALPEVIRERYSAGRPLVCLCGVLPRINRAWVTVDASLFLWRFDKPGDIPLEYRGQEQAISAVGLVEPRRGVFWEAISQLLVICTPVEISLLGVVLQPGATGDELEELTLQPMPMYTISSDAVMMLCIAVAAGRIFMGGDDGHLYELQYSSGEKWMQKRCKKVCLTSNLWASFLPGFLQTKPSPLEQIAIDESRGILYTRHRNSAIFVFDIGQGCRGSPVKVAECTNLPEVAKRAGPNALGRRLFGVAEGARRGELSPSAVVYIAVVDRTESQRLHLVALTADGRRVYFSTTSSYSVWSSSSSSRLTPRPTDLRAKLVRKCPEVPSVSGRMKVEYGFYSQGVLLLSHTSDRLAHTELVLSSPDQTQAVGGVVRRDLTEIVDALPVEGVVCAISEVPVPEALSSAVPRHAGAGNPVPGAGIRQDLLLQHVMPPRRYVILSNVGLVEVERLRPVDILGQLLREGNKERLLQFFKSHGIAEACAMCLVLGTPVATAESVEAAELASLFQKAYGLSCSDAHFVKRAVTASAVTADAARKVYEDVTFTGEPIQDAAAPAAGTSGGGYGAEAPGPAAAAPKVHLSGAYEGLALYTARLLSPLWEHALMGERKVGSHTRVELKFKSSTLRILEERVRSLEKYLHGRECRRLAANPAYSNYQAREDPSLLETEQLFGSRKFSYKLSVQNKRQRIELAAEQEAQKVKSIRITLMRSAEALQILRLLQEKVGADISGIINRLDSSVRAHLVRGGTGTSSSRVRHRHYITLRDLVATKEGEEVIRDIIAAMMTHQMDVSKVADVETVGLDLEKKCPTFFHADDRTFYDARVVLRKAKRTSDKAAKERYTNEALASLLKVPSVVNLPAVIPELAGLRCWEGVVALPLRASAARDQSDLAARPGAVGDEARKMRKANYSLVTDELKYLMGLEVQELPLTTTPGGPLPGNVRDLSPGDKEEARQTVFAIAFNTRDKHFHYHLYQFLISMGWQAQQELIKRHPTFLEEYLCSQGNLPAGGMLNVNLPPLEALDEDAVLALQLLTELYKANAAHGQAAVLQLLLAQRKYGLGTQGVTLQERRKHMADAVAHIKTQATGQGTGHMTVDVDYFETKLQVLEIQIQLHQKMSAAAGKAAALGLPAAEVKGLKDKVQNLEIYICDLTELYNDYGYPEQFWDLCLEMLFLAKYTEATTIQDLWDKCLETAAQAGDLGTHNLAQACESVLALGKRFWPNETMLPLQHLSSRLDEIAAGMWPIKGPPASGESLEEIPKVLLQITDGSAERLRRAYDSLLMLPSARPALKLQHLKTLSILMGKMAKDIKGMFDGSGVPTLLGKGTMRDVGNFTSLLERYALMARNLPLNADETGAVADQLEDIFTTMPAFSTDLL